MALWEKVFLLSVAFGLLDQVWAANLYITVVHDSEQTGDCLSNWRPQDCFHSSATKCCLEVNDIEEKLSLTSVTIHFESERSSQPFVLHKSLIFANYTKLELRGSKTVIECNQTEKGLSSEEGIGLTFRNVSNFYASNLIFQNCGLRHNSTSVDKQNKAINCATALLFDHCENVHLASVTVRKSHGIGMSMLEVVGRVTFDNCLFRENFMVNAATSGGGGLYIELSSNEVSIRGVYTISRCNFTANQATTSITYTIKDRIRTFGQGGGMIISLRKNASNHSFKITECKFKNNTAVWGGGLHLFVTDSSQNNTVTVNSSLFQRNNASAGGGGMTIYMLSSSPCTLYGNSIHIHNSNFSQGFAKNQGGGTLILSSLHNKGESCNKMNLMCFSACRWTSNKASYSAAIDITTRHSTSDLSLPLVPVFSSCTITGNMHIPVESSRSNAVVEKLHGKAVMMVLCSHIKFKNFVRFSNNRGTSLHAISSRIDFSNGTLATFDRNEARRGGAIALIASYLDIGNHVYMNFTKNRAYVVGGAIYSISLGEHELHRNIYGLSCFVRCKRNDNITLRFQDNTASSYEGIDEDGFSYGKSIFAASIRSCVVRNSNITLTNVSDVLDSIATFNFFNSSAYEEVVTSPETFTLSEEINYEIIPGKEFHVPVLTKDSFGHKLKSNYEVFIKRRACRNSTGSITIATKYTSLPASELKIFGDPGVKCTIGIQREGSQLLSVYFNVSLIQCPPGYVLIENEQQKALKETFSRMECVCAFNTESPYRGVTRCNDTTFQANVMHYFWVGYDTESDNVSPSDLITAYCPRSFCSYNSSKFSYEYQLPGTANRTILSKFICRNGRTGKICGRCMTNHSVYFNSPNYLCKENHLCTVGWLFYLIAELFTLTILFVVILSFNISFTSGVLNGFIFYAQIIDIISVSVLNHKSYYPLSTEITTRALVFVYHFFNLNFFYHDKMSFCLWEGASTMDIIAIKYLTIVYAFILVLSVFAFMNICTVGQLKYYSKKLVLRQSVIHGISTFLVTCFAQTVKVTFHIFRPGFITKRGSQISSIQALYEGDIQLFGNDHLKYALPGSVLFITIAIIPTMLLLCYPTGCKAMYKCRVSESKISKLQQVFCINRLRPLFDSFQGCYKDKYRFFAGLYFVYRFSILASSSYSLGATQFHVFVQIQLSVMLLFHCLTQPYKKTTHNALDTLILVNLLVINTLSGFIHTKGQRQYLYTTTIQAFAVLQTVLTGLPIICLLLYTLVKVIMKLKTCCKRKNVEVVDLHIQEPNFDDIPFRLLNESSETFD